jgi:hypothetical protein
VFEADVSNQDQQAFNSNLEHAPEEEGMLDVVVDVIALPFRGVGWILQQVF